MEKNIHTQSDHSVLDAPHIRTTALDSGYSSVNLYDQVDSTTTRARELLMDGTDPEREQLGELSIYASLYQSAGRGRLARAWTAPPGACLAASIVVRPHASADPLARELPEGSYHWMTLIAGLSVVDIWRGYGVDAALKWPNDVLVDGARKICGILAQLAPASSPFTTAAILGYGVNIGQERAILPTAQATSLAAEGDQSAGEDPTGVAHELLGQILAGLDRRISSLVRHGDAMSAGLLAEAEAALPLIGTRIALASPTDASGTPALEGLALGRAPTGALLLRTADGHSHRIDAGGVLTTGIPLTPVHDTKEKRANN